MAPRRSNEDQSVPYLECGPDELTHIKVMILATVEVPHCHAIPKLGRFPINWNHLIEKESLKIR